MARSIVLVTKPSHGSRRGGLWSAMQQPAVLGQLHQREKRDRDDDHQDRPRPLAHTTPPLSLASSTVRWSPAIRLSPALRNPRSCGTTNCILSETVRCVALNKCTVPWAALNVDPEKSVQGGAAQEGSPCFPDPAFRL